MIAHAHCSDEYAYYINMRRYVKKIALVYNPFSRGYSGH